MVYIYGYQATETAVLFDCALSVAVLRSKLCNRTEKRCSNGGRILPWSSRWQSQSLCDVNQCYTCLSMALIAYIEYLSKQGGTPYRLEFICFFMQGKKKKGPTYYTGEEDTLPFQLRVYAASWLGELRFLSLVFHRLIHCVHSAHHCQTR